MDIGVTVPQRAYERDEILTWAANVEAGPFASITTGERIAFETHDSFIAHAVMAGATERVRLVTGVNVLPIHQEVLFAKQAASLDKLSGGRFVLGMGIGPRPQDFAVTETPWEGRAKRFEEKLAVMRRVWAGEPPYPDTEPVGPPIPPGRPEVHIGGFSDNALRRAGRLADGLRSFDFHPDPTIHLQRKAIALEGREQAGRTDPLRIVASTYFAVGPGARETYEAGMRTYYSYDDETSEWALSPDALCTPEAIVDAIQRFEDAGIDEMVFVASFHEGPDVVKRLADVVGPHIT